MSSAAVPASVSLISAYALPLFCLLAVTSNPQCLHHVPPAVTPDILLITSCSMLQLTSASKLASRHNMHADQCDGADTVALLQPKF